ncbi:hypothetical protein [Flavobacterium rhizosphaerae]|uniref:Uncharacterized protein n=1 Tax=Flavobacterium rhizosphaerae TaxID=3163298 RepID=A0ABW8YX07_9FLAO
MTKEKVLDLFHNPPKSQVDFFNHAFQLYSQSPNKNAAIVRSLNTGGYSRYNLESLIYELQKAYGITDKEKIKPLSQAQTVIDGPLGMSYRQGIRLNPPGNSQNADLIAQDANKLSSGTQPAAEDEPQKIRSEYPFLNDKNCPDELLILVGKKIAAYNRYKEAHENLQEAKEGKIQLTEDEQLALAKEATENFAESEAIKKELDHYLEKKEVLGEHPIFARLTLEREVEAMTNEECLKFVKGSASYISKKNKAIASATTDERKAKLQAELKDRQDKLELVNKKLGAGK